MRWYGVLAVLILVAGSAVPAAARDRHARDYRIQPLDRILPHIRHSRPGTFYDAEGPFRGPDGRMHYRLKWMTPDGRIIWLDTDAGTGRVLGESGAGRPGWAPGPRGERRRYAPRQEHRGYDRGYDGGHERGRRRNFERDGGWGDRSGGGFYHRGGGYDRGHDRGHGHSRGHRH